MTLTPPPLPPLDVGTAQRIALVAVKPGAHTLVGPRVLAALLHRITELELTEALLRRELGAYQARALEDARLRAHAMYVGKWGGAGR